MQIVLRITQLPKRPTNWVIELDCGHIVACYAEKRPLKIPRECHTCDLLKAGERREAESQRAESGGAL